MGQPRGDRRRAQRPAPDGEAALEIAARYLGARPRSRWEVTRRLERAGAIEAVTLATLDRLAALGHIDDLAFARWWAEQRDRHAPRGRRLIEAELRQRGVPREVLEQLRAEREDEDDAEGEADPTEAPVPATDRDRARAALARYLRGTPLPDSPGDRQRLAAFLARRGFDSDVIWSVLRAPEAANGDE